MNTQSKKLSNLQNDLLKARESGEAKDLEIYEKNFEISKLNDSLKVAQNDISLKLKELEEKNNELLNIRGTLKGANTDIEEKTKQIEVFSDNFPMYIFCFDILHPICLPHKIPLC